MGFTNLQVWSGGGGGGNMARSFRRQCAEAVARNFKWFAFDTNPDALDEAKKEFFSLETIAIGPEGTQGSGCVPAVARSAFEYSELVIKEKLTGAQVVIAFFTLGKGTGTGTIVPFTKLCLEQRAIPLVCVALPSVEGKEVGTHDRNVALKVLRELDNLKVRFIQIDNNAIWRTPALRAMQFLDARAELDRLVAQTVSNGLAKFFAFPTSVDRQDFRVNVMLGKAGRLQPVFGEVDLAAADFSVELESKWKEVAEVAYYELGPHGQNAMLIWEGPWTTDQLGLLNTKIVQRFNEGCRNRFRCLEGYYKIDEADTRIRKAQTKKQVGRFTILLCSDVPRHSIAPSTGTTVGDKKAVSADKTPPTLRVVVRQASEGNQPARQALQKGAVSGVTVRDFLHCLPNLISLSQQGVNTLALKALVLPLLADPASPEEDFRLPVPFEYEDEEGKKVVLTAETTLEELEKAVKKSSLGEPAVANLLRNRLQVWTLWGPEAASQLTKQAPVGNGGFGYKLVRPAGSGNRLLAALFKPS